MGNIVKMPRKEGEKKRIYVNRKIHKVTITKLTVFFGLILLLFVVLAVRLVWITRNNGEEYKQQVLSQQKYNGTTLPYQRGAIVDRNGTTLAYSEQVYNIILDSNLMSDESLQERLEPTLQALNECFGLNINDVRTYIRNNQSSRYHILMKQLTYDEIQPYIEMRDAEGSMLNRSGIWFETEYRRQYPYGTLACDVIGFAKEDGTGYGLEQYYDDVLSGNNGREYGYLSDNNTLEKTIIPAENGNTIVTTIDAYIQRIVEQNIIEFNEEHANEYREGEMGSDNTGVIIMDVNTGEVLAMASYPLFDLNNPNDLTPFYTDEAIAQLEAEGNTQAALNAIWKNFCINQSYEPGSVCKTFTVAAGLDSGTVHDSDIYECGGYITYGEGQNATTIRCHNRYGDGPLTTKQALEKSCNVALMRMGERMGSETYLRYFRNFNFGLKTNIDLTGEMRTDSLVFTEATMGTTELATSTFGQGYNVTMIQVISAFCSLVNGGYYYQPHMVSQVLDENGSVVQNIEPVLLRQTVSESTSDLMIDYCIGVVEEGTGTYARPYGYRIGGKTGTAEHSGAGKIDYVVSFMGFAPADDPQIAIYVVIDRPNVASQEYGTRYACLLCRSILTDVLPYLNIFMTEELTETERQELEEHNAQALQQLEENYSNTSAPSAIADTVSENDADNSGDGMVIEVIEIEDDSSETENDDSEWQINIDPATGYAIDPLTGEFLDPETGVPINGDESIFQYGTGNNEDE
ncbi:MAG: penicillin-binding transpeptidase domain-containing protein [Lachnospiraceae bacterium]